MSFKNVKRDERTEHIENKSYKYGYNILIIGILSYHMYRTIKFKEFSFALIGLVSISEYAVIAYQYKENIIKWDKLLSFWVVFTAIISTLAFIFIFPNLR